MIEAIVGTKYAAFIAGAYGITFATIFGMVLATIITARARSKSLQRLQAEGLRRGSKASSADE